MRRQTPESHLIAELFVCGPIAMLIWSETALLHGRGPSARELMG
ncbi:hypothetical protein VMT65_05205 [Nocardia sp. CDC153]|nr:hypothetical protein [Nocardia sp. CDC153]MEC3952427.1 hypothetical protein [Nocardia sp. CDC153]